MEHQVQVRLNELEKILQLQFSDLGSVYVTNIDVQRVALMEPIQMWGTPLPSALYTPYTGCQITVQFNFHPKTRRYP